MFSEMLQKNTAEGSLLSLQKAGALWWLFELQNRSIGHLSAHLGEHRFHCIARMPRSQSAHFRDVDVSVILIDARKVDAVHKRNNWRLCRIAWATVNFQAVDSIFEWCFRGTKNRPIPMCKSHVVVILKTPADSAVATSSFLALL